MQDNRDVHKSQAELIAELAERLGRMDVVRLEVTESNRASAPPAPASARRTSAPATAARLKHRLGAVLPGHQLGD